MQNFGSMPSVSPSGATPFRIRSFSISFTKRTVFWNRKSLIVVNVSQHAAACVRRRDLMFHQRKSTSTQKIKKQKLKRAQKSAPATPERAAGAEGTGARTSAGAEERSGEKAPSGAKRKNNRKKKEAVQENN